MWKGRKKRRTEGKETEGKKKAISEKYEKIQAGPWHCENTQAM